jgi:putative ABC transport system permease protein
MAEGAVVVSLLSGLLFGALPSLYAGRVHTLGSRDCIDNRGRRTARETLIASQVALTIVLLAASISVGRALIHLARMDRGFESSGVVTVNVSLEGTTHQSAGSRLAYFEEALGRIRRLPGVESASATEFLPLYATTFVGGLFQLDGRPASESSALIPVLPDFFRTMGVKILASREISDAELRGKARVAVVNERFASEFGAAASAVGRKLTIGNEPPWQIVGVVKGMDYMREGKIDGDPFNQVFVPAESPGGFFATFVARVNGRAGDHLAMIRDVVQSVDPQVPVFGVKTMEQRLNEALAQPQFYRTAVCCFAGFGLVLATMGIYGMVSYNVVQRIGETGIRMALGGTATRLRVSLLGRSLIPILAGAVPGVIGTALSGRLLESLVVGAQTLDFATYGSAVLCIAWTALIGIWVATRPIRRCNVMEILRTEWPALCGLSSERPNVPGRKLRKNGPTS